MHKLCQAELSNSTYTIVTPPSKVCIIDWPVAAWWGYSLIWPIQGCATRQGMVFGLSVVNRVCNFMQVCPKQSLDLSQIGNGYTIVVIKYVIQYFAILHWRHLLVFKTL